MSYEYKVQRPYVFTEEGVEKMLYIQAWIDEALAFSGAVRMAEILSRTVGDTWDRMAIVDYLCEQEVLLEITQGERPGQDRVFVRHPNWRGKN